ncbi:hypothetical protein ARMGADRAFT_1030432 [Armillaria gallica]|uniref:CCHC-type domain-containing protein n=1 Tax=Armillaria gallica TaxID=47427 RepID=A0A2H3DCL0_ARMGA|nr:hypothetical protein ARMGADRAFT_1030432 [Armillaria gallica]
MTTCSKKLAMQTTSTAVNSQQPQQNLPGTDSRTRIPVLNQNKVKNSQQGLEPGPEVTNDPGSDSTEHPCETDSTSHSICDKGIGPSCVEERETSPLMPTGSVAEQEHVTEPMNDIGGSLMTPTETPFPALIDVDRMAPIDRHWRPTDNVSQEMLDTSDNIASGDNNMHMGYLEPIPEYDDDGKGSEFDIAEFESVRSGSPGNQSDSGEPIAQDRQPDSGLPRANSAEKKIEDENEIPNEEDLDDRLSNAELDGAIIRDDRLAYDLAHDQNDPWGPQGADEEAVQQMLNDLNDHQRAATHVLAHRQVGQMFRRFPIDEIDPDSDLYREQYNLTIVTMVGGRLVMGHSEKRNDEDTTDSGRFLSTEDQRRRVAERARCGKSTGKVRPFQFTSNDDVQSSKSSRPSSRVSVRNPIVIKMEEITPRLRSESPVNDDPPPDDHEISEDSNPDDPLDGERAGSPPSGHNKQHETREHSPQRPRYGKTLKDKVILQRWRNRDLADTGRTDIANQGIHIDSSGKAFIVKGGIADPPRKEPTDHSNESTSNEPQNNHQHVAHPQEDHQGIQEDHQEDRLGHQVAHLTHAVSVIVGYHVEVGEVQEQYQDDRLALEEMEDHHHHHHCLQAATQMNRIVQMTRVICTITLKWGIMTQRLREAIHTMHARIERYAEEHLGIRMHLPDGVKPPRLDAKNISPYGGSSSVSEFWTWFKSLVMYLEASQLGGSDRDRERKLLIEPVLSGAAKKWYHDHVIEVNEYANWTFVSVIIGIYNCFIHDSAMQEARTKFDCATFSDGGGTAEGYRDLLQTLIRDMMRKPDDYTVTRRFVTRLPHEIRSTVFEDRLNVEVNSLDEFVESAKAYEDTERSKCEYGRAPSSSSNPTPVHERGKGNPNDKDHSRPSKGRMFIRMGKFFRTERDQGPKPASPSPEANVRQFAPCFDKGRHLPPRDGMQKDLSNVCCFKCGEKGHYASFHDKERDSANPRIRAAHTVVGGDIKDDDMDLDIESQSNYDHEDWHEVEFEEYPNQDSDSDNQTEYMGMMRHTQSPEFRESSEEPSEESEEPDSSESEVDRYRIRYLSSRQFDEYDHNLLNYQHKVRVIPTQTKRTDCLKAMTEQEQDARPSTRYKLKIASQPRARPMYSPDDKRCLATYMTVNSMSAYTLWAPMNATLTDQIVIIWYISQQTNS